MKKKKHHNYLVDIAIVVALIAITAIPRLYMLDTLPSGLHGDEAWTGLDARRILEEGYIGPFVVSALGQPTGPLYFTALIFKLFGDSIYWLRFSMTIFSIGTIPLFYLFARLFLGRYASTLSALAFSFSLIHLHFSRIGFMVISMPVFQLIALICLFLSVRYKRMVLFLVGAMVTGFGMYSYNAFMLFPATLFPYIAEKATTLSKTLTSKKALLLFYGVFLCMLIPLMHYAITKPQQYTGHFTIVNPTYNQYTGHVVSLADTPKTYLGNAQKNILQYLLGGDFDYVDAFGTYPPHLPFTFGIGIIGMVYALRQKKRSHELSFLFISLLISSLGLFLTSGGIHRRTILMLVYLFFFTGLGIHAITTTVPKKWKTVALIGITLVLLIEGALNLRTYFVSFAHSRQEEVVFGTALTRSMQYLKEHVPADQTVYFYSHRWACDYETVQYLHPDITCVNRSREHGFYTLEVPKGEPATLVFLDWYRSANGRIPAVYPEARQVPLTRNGQTLGVIVHIDE